MTEKNFIVFFGCGKATNKNQISEAAEQNGHPYSQVAGVSGYEPGAACR